MSGTRRSTTTSRRSLPHHRALVLTPILTLTLTLTLARTLTLTLTRSRTRTLALPLTPGAARRRVACGHGGDQHRRVQHRAHPGQHGVRELHEQSHHLRLQSHHLSSRWAREALSAWRAWALLPLTWGVLLQHNAGPSPGPGADQLSWANSKARAVACGSRRDEINVCEKEDIA